MEDILRVILFILLIIKLLVLILVLMEDTLRANGLSNYEETVGS